jgi:tetratricopeptide (TPR) repeat protein
MIANTNGEPRTQVAALSPDESLPREPAAEAALGKHFDTWETDFFRQGDDGGSLPADVGQPDDFERGGRIRGPILSWPSLLSLSIVSTCLALLACSALWRSNAPIPTLPSAGAPSTRTAGVATAVKPASTAPAVAVSPEVPAPAVAPPATAESAAAAREPSAPVLAPAVDSGVRERCLQSIREKRNKQILALCPAAFAEGASDADLAVTLAKVEFDRGRFAQAQAWSRKAIAINPDSADAYVFVGGAEQYQGHRKAAKEAYLHYLRLAPSGRYAGELRSIVNSL